MFKLFRPFPNTIGRAFIVLTTAAILLTGWGQPAQAQTEAFPAWNPPDVSAKTANDAPNKSSEKPQPAPQSPSEDSLPGPSSAAEKWVERYEKLIAGIQNRSLNQEDADSFFQGLNAALGDMRDRLRNMLATSTSLQSRPSEDTSTKAISESPQKAPDKQQSQESPSPDQEVATRSHRFRNAEEMYSDLTVLYNLRIQLLEQISPTLRNTVTGTDIGGVQAFKEEIDFLLLTFRLHFHSLSQLGRRSVSDIMRAPISVFLVLVQLCAAFLVFYWWRRWAVKGIPKLRSSILDIKPRKLIHKWLAKLLWYLNRVRSPLEWGLLLSVLFNIISTSEGLLVYSLLWTNARLILVAWFVVVLVDAMSTRGAAGLRSSTASLRLRSFWLIAVWALVVALGLGITKDLAGKGTIYAWIWIFSKLLALPVLFLLVRWWRPEIYRNLEEVPRQPTYVQKILEHPKGLVSFFGAALGAAYLIMNGLRQWVLRVMTAYEGGRYLIANLTRLEAIRVSERKPQKVQGDPISDEMRHLLLTDDGGIVESVGQDSLERMVQMVEHGRKGAAVVVAERGGGKTHLLKRLANQLEGKMMFFNCPPGGIVAFKKAFAEVLGLNTANPTPEDISDRLQENQIGILGIDNLHGLSRPAFGGQQDMDQIAAIFRAVQTHTFWFFGVDWAAWQYISRVRDGRLFLNEVLKMPLWSEEQIRELIELRSAQAGIEADFGDLVLPRQFESNEFKTMEDRNSFGFYRILWNASDGNPMVSLHLWADSLRVAPDGRIRVLLPQLPVTTELENVSISVLLALRVIAQSEMANQEKIVDSLRLPEIEVAGALSLALAREWIESVEGHYRLTWKWFRSITRVLARQNLLVRKTLGG